MLSSSTGETIIYGSAEERGELVGEVLIDVALGKGIQKGTKILGKSKFKKLYLEKYGDDFGKMGKYVENPNITVN
ncbi:hypothetical protein [Vallitalea sp.]|jgi:hypothetical protein|uniref:hypothetical protein n=1 Tax=Vallitalea sp. TaxID=1882829 RepID=UPI0025EC1ED6|nr:hypothetical protein [Vallitalea sp.]MCT4687169.1 hypothetical protein [Vallitalea sp.]